MGYVGSSSTKLKREIFVVRHIDGVRECKTGYLPFFSELMSTLSVISVLMAIKSRALINKKIKTKLI